MASGADPWPWPGAPWDWLGEPLAVDFASTVKRRGAEYVELLRDADDLLTWCRHEAERVPAIARRDAARGLGTVRAVRDDVLVVLRAAAAGEPPPPGAAARLDERARRHPVVAQLTGLPAVAPGVSPLEELLARTVASAIELARAGADGRLAFCDAPSCGQLFMRERGGQRWCGPACGTRARVARHAARHRTSTA